MRTTRSSSHGGGLVLIPLNFPLGCGPGSDPLQFPLGCGSGSDPLNFPLGCGPGPVPPQFPPWVWAWQGVLLGRGVSLAGGSPCQDGLLGKGGLLGRGVSLAGGISQHALRQTPPLADLRGGARDARPPPGGPNSFIFMQFPGTKLKNNSTFGSWRPPLGKILDPPLPSVNRMTDTCENITLPQLRCGR